MQTMWKGKFYMYIRNIKYIFRIPNTDVDSFQIIIMTDCFVSMLFIESININLCLH